MASEDDPTIFPDDDFDDSVISSSSDSASSDPLTLVVLPPSSSAAVTVAAPPPPPPPPPSAVSAVPSDSRRLFQRLWTDEDEIELLQGFLDYTASRGGATASGHYHDTAAFYDQIKNKLQLEFNKSQLVEKLRRLKKKYRTVVSKMSCGHKEFVFKSPHDHATFQLSSKIWSHLYRGGGGVEVDDDDLNLNHNLNPNPNPSYNPVTIAAVTPPRPLNSSYIVSHINLNSVSPGGGSGGGGGGGFDMMLTNWSGNGPSSGSGLSKLCTRKRSRVATTGKVEEKVVKSEGGISNTNNDSMNNINNNNAIDNSLASDNIVNNNNNVGVSSPLQGMVEETVRNCLSPVLKGLISNVVNGATIANSSELGGGSRGFKGVGALALNAVPLNFSGVSVGERNVEGGMDEKWRKQQIMELEVYSKRLELVQDQIKLSLEELRSMES